MKLLVSTALALSMLATPVMAEEATTEVVAVEEKTCPDGYVPGLVVDSKSRGGAPGSIYTMAGPSTHVEGCIDPNYVKPAGKCGFICEWLAQLSTRIDEAVANI